MIEYHWIEVSPYMITKKWQLIFIYLLVLQKKKKKVLKPKVNISHKNSEKHDGCEKKKLGIHHFVPQLCYNFDVIKSLKKSSELMWKL